MNHSYHRMKSIKVAIWSVVALLSSATAAADFLDDLARVDEALKANPSFSLRQSVESCIKQRGFAVRLYNMGMQTRAQRALRYCFESLRIPEQAPEKVSAPGIEELQAAAAQEYEEALALPPNIAQGLAIYRECAACHEPEGWGMTSGSVPQIAGQHRTVVIKQLADFRAGNRDSAVMIPYATVEAIGGAQAVADVAAYIDTLEISVANGKGPGNDLVAGKLLYEQHCASCHGDTGEGSNEDQVPRIQAQHYRYLKRQYEWIRDGKRRNANAEMAAQIQNFTDREVEAVLDYVSRLEPPVELQAPQNWQNPDFK